MSANTNIFLDATVRLDQIPPEGRSVDFAADAEALERLRERLKVDTVEAVSADLHVVRLRGGLHVTGLVRAAIVQPCVVTFDPVTQAIDESVDRVFLPASQRPKDPEPGTETFVDLEGEDPPDYLEGNELDLTELTIETIALAIDPYPRAPGAEVVQASVDETPEDESPFSKLKDLKTQQKSD